MENRDQNSSEKGQNHSDPSSKPEEEQQEMEKIVKTSSPNSEISSSRPLWIYSVITFLSPALFFLLIFGLVYFFIIPYRHIDGEVYFQNPLVTLLTFSFGLAFIPYLFALCMNLSPKKLMSQYLILLGAFFGLALATFWGLRPLQASFGSTYLALITSFVGTSFVLGLACDWGPKTGWLKKAGLSLLTSSIFPALALLVLWKLGLALNPSDNPLQESTLGILLSFSLVLSLPLGVFWAWTNGFYRRRAEEDPRKRALIHTSAFLGFLILTILASALSSQLITSSVSTMALDYKEKVLNKGEERRTLSLLVKGKYVYLLNSFRNEKREDYSAPQNYRLYTLVEKEGSFQEKYVHNFQAPHHLQLVDVLGPKFVFMKKNQILFFKITSPSKIEKVGKIDLKDEVHWEYFGYQKVGKIFSLLKGSPRGKGGYLYQTEEFYRKNSNRVGADKDIYSFVDHPPAFASQGANLYFLEEDGVQVYRVQEKFKELKLKGKKVSQGFTISPKGKYDFYPDLSDILGRDLDHHLIEETHLYVQGDYLLLGLDLDETIFTIWKRKGDKYHFQASLNPLLKRGSHLFHYLRLTDDHLIIPYDNKVVKISLPK